MIAKPSIAFDSFSGSAKSVTARNMDGRNILSSRINQNRTNTRSQTVSRNTFSMISRVYKSLTESQMSGWAVLAEKLKGLSVFGKTAELTPFNAFVRVNSNRSLLNLKILTDAPSNVPDIPILSFEDFWLTPENFVFVGVDQPETTYSLILRMASSQSAGVSNKWNQLTIVSPSLVPVKGEINAMDSYKEKYGLSPVLGNKYFLEMCWLDSETGLTGPSLRADLVCGLLSYVSKIEFCELCILTTSDFKSSSKASGLDITLERIPGANLLFVNASYNQTSGTMLSLSLVEAQTKIPSRSYHTFARGRGTRKFGVGLFMLNINTSSISVSFYGGKYDGDKEMFGVTC